MLAETGLSSSPILGEPSGTAASIVRTGHLPRPTLGIIGEIERAIRALARTPALKERVCEYIQTEVFYYSFGDATCTQPPSRSILKASSKYSKWLRIWKVSIIYTLSVFACKPFVRPSLLSRLSSNLAPGSTTVTLNDHSMYEHILEDDLFFGVVGMLECL